MASGLVVLWSYQRLRPKDDSDSDQDDDERTNRWTYCLITGSLLVVYMVIFFGAILYLQLKSELPTVTVKNGTMSNYTRSETDGKLYSAMELSMLAHNPTSTTFTISDKSSLHLEDEELGEIAELRVQRFVLEKKAKSTAFRCYFPDTQWRLNVNQDVLRKFQPPVTVELVVRGDLVVHYEASKILSDVSRKVGVRTKLNVTFTQAWH